MSDTKHTKGPWIAYGTWVSTSDGPLIADCDTDVNADLIAAAPELLAACEWMLEHCDQGGVVGKEPCDNARAAIAKAKGETP